MAINKRQAGADPVMTVRAAATAPATPTSGTPVMLNTLPGVALTDEDTAGECTIDLGPSIFSLGVEAKNAGGNEAVAKGNSLYYDGGVINRDSVNGKFFGIALGVISSGGTGTIDVLIGKGVSVDGTGS